MSTPKKIAGTFTIPVLTLLILEVICLSHGENIITNQKGFDNFVVYTAIVMITTIALSINLNSGRFDFSLGRPCFSVCCSGSEDKLCSIRRRLRKCSTYAGNHYCGRRCAGNGIWSYLCDSQDSAHHNIFGCNPDL